eukprot:412905-Pelagomonas_calceolata.AAC.2
MPPMQVRGVILDPSCSGSGTVFTRMDHLLPSFQRRQQLQQHQEQHHQENAETSSEGGSSEDGLSNDEYVMDCADKGGNADTHEPHHSMEGLQGSQGHADTERIRHLSNFQ